MRWDQTTQTVEEQWEEHWEEQQEEQQQEEQISEEKTSEDKISAAIPDARARALALYKKLAKSPPSRKAMLRAKTLELYKRLVKKSKSARHQPARGQQARAAAAIEGRRSGAAGHSTRAACRRPAVGGRSSSSTMFDQPLAVIASRWRQ